MSPRARRAVGPAAWIVAVLSAASCGVLWIAWLHPGERPDANPPGEGARSPERAVLRAIREGELPSRVAPWSRFEEADVRFRESRDAAGGALVLVLRIAAPPREHPRGLRCRIEVLTRQREGGWYAERVLEEASACQSGGSQRSAAGDRPAARR